MSTQMTEQNITEQNMTERNMIVTVCDCGNCTAIKGLNANELCDICNGTARAEREKSKKPVVPKYIGATDPITNHTWAVVVADGVAMGAYFGEEIYEGFSSEDEANIRYQEYKNANWTLLTEEQVKKYLGM